jgi:hypothetical protein
MSYDKNVKQKAFRLRSSGHSFHEISLSLTVPKGTIYTWTKNLQLDDNARMRINSRKVLGRQNATKTRLKKAVNQQYSRQKQAEEGINAIITSPSAYKIITACLYWAEGSKNQNSLIFTNSDPSMISLFLTTLRNCFLIDESKFRVIVHLHQYHNQQETIDFWTKITKIPQHQFYKPYLKPHTSKRKHKDYHGCCSVRYYDANLAKLLTATYRHISKTLI